MQCDKILLARYQSMSGRLLAADGWIDRSIDDDDDENGQDSTRVMNSLVWFVLIVIPQGKAWEGKGRKAFDPSHPHPARHPASKFGLRMK